MNGTEQDDYVLRGGVKGAERLRQLAAVKWPTTKILLDKVGLRPGWRCLDVGCGIGAVALHMAQAVGSSGNVVGLDLDADCLELARKNAQTLGLSAEFRLGMVGDLREACAYDLVFARFVLTHLRDPAHALSRMAQAVRPGGVVVVEDIQFTGHFCYPDCSAFARYVDLYQQVVRHRGGDANIGPRLVGLFLDAGLAPVELEVIQPTYRQGLGKRLAGVTMEHIREAVVAAGLASDDEISAIVAELDRFAADPRSIMSLPRIFQVWSKA
jgi:predicted O-methyltransferase YrrM